MKQINLIPNELAVSPKYVRVAKEINKVSVFGLSVFAFFLTLFLVFYFYYTNTVNKVNQEVLDLKSSITSLEGSEQRLILIKDRLSKINKVKKSNFMEDKIANAKLVLDEINKIEPQDQTSVVVNKDMTEMNFKLTSSLNVTNSLTKLGSLGLYKSVVFPSITMNSGSLFNINVNFQNE